ncbi:MAG: Phosphatidylglycerol--prolipoprotein diacylglyceryl transferase [Eubacteriales bacterium SKADARSKE-1]|nr:Phosphatidylglycerol--prolipoprotein diacylglyceryl transferase [Eubacteriales bacterium SKADARSKE-1]
MVGTKYHIEFPAMGLSFEINPVAFKIGGISVYWYGIIIGFGFILAFLYTMKNSKRFDLDQDKLIDVIIIGLITGLIGARLYYVIFYPGDMYVKEPTKILFINQGGIAIYGGIIGAILGGLVVCKIKKLEFLKVLDIASLGFLIGQAIGRWGNFTNQEAFGTQTDSFFGMLSENTGNIAVHPCFLYESVWCAIGFLLLHIFSLKYKQRFDGEIFLLYVAWYSAGRFFIEGLRTDSLMIPGSGIRVSQVLAAVAVLVCGLLLIIKKIKQRAYI